ncbi:uncharacterized protein LOC117791812 [Drosophila innubila]|uniref:uncharacterized protein LOC117791812 n=1 Tax=Drosophila innubila TaxID=198719 RepID=UPI00148CD3B8|nr:uncharacterized protein LOC117791812 [Drosophila innubila]
MAPFSVCSQCNKRTRKVVKDLITLKDIYLCPKCTKTRDERVRQEEGKEMQRETAKVQLNKPKEEAELMTSQSLPLAATVSSPAPTPAPAPVLATVPALNTPPIMQIVTIKGRKYIAVSATASDN